MSDHSRQDRKDRNDRPGDALDRRGFLRQAGAVAAIAGAAGCAHGGAAKPAKPEATPPASQPASQPAGGDPEAGDPVAEARVRRHRTLGRTGFAVSDIGLGCGRLAEASVVRYAYDRGVNLLDTAERYGNGDSERKIGEAMQHLDRKKIFIVTKLGVKKDEAARSIVERFGKCLERMRTDHADALYMHSVTDVAMVKHAGFHRAISQLKAAGRVKHAGISSHGPRGKGDSMEKVLTAAADDGRFDLMLLVHNFMNSEASGRVLAACEAKNVGTTLMKVSPAVLEPIADFDPSQPTAKQSRWIGLMTKRGMSLAQAQAAIAGRVRHGQAEMARHKATIDAFVSKHGVKTAEQLKRASLTWAMTQQGVDTVCVSMPDFEAIDVTLPVSGAKLAAADEGFLRDYAASFSGSYCRHGCTACAASCPRGVPVSTVMRYAYYFSAQGREKHAMGKYAALGAACSASGCEACDGPCAAACPHGLDVRGQLRAAHQRLEWVG